MLGCYKEALEPAEDANAIYKSLAENRPATFNPDVARSLRVLSNTLGQLDRHDDSRRAIEGATNIYRTLAVRCPAAFNSYLAGCLYTFSLRLSVCGRQADALKVIKEAIKYYRLLEVDDPALSADLERAIEQQVCCLTILGHEEEAAQASK
jgi:tetratricopeptide (TPR) repeat protein